jgi:cytochrome c556
MRKTFTFLLMQLALLGSVVPAQLEVDDDLMRNIEDTMKSLDSNVAIKDVKAARAEARELADLFAQIEAYYARKGDTPDAVGFSRKTHDLAAQVLKAVETQDFDTASDTVNQFIKSCKPCHQVYKKDK